MRVGIPAYSARWRRCPWWRRRGRTWRWGRRSARGIRRCIRTRKVSGNRDFVAFRVHALDISEVVAPLRAVGRAFCRARTRQRACGQSDSGADRSAAAAIGCGSRRSADQGADRSAFRSAVARGLIRRGPADLVNRKLPAFKIVGAKLVEALAAAGQCHHARSRGHCRAGGQRQQRTHRRQQKRALHDLHHPFTVTAATAPAASRQDIP